MHEVADALAEVLARVGPRRPALEALGPTVLGRVLAEEVRAEMDSPPFPKSLRDGYAVRAVDCASPNAILRVVSEIAAGSVPARAIGPGECARIFTGAPIPEGADAVVMQEDTQTLANGTVRIADAVVKPGQHVFARGTEMRAGDTVLEAGTCINAAALGVLAGLGRTSATLYPSPRVAVLSTGDELVEAGEDLKPGQIRNSNGPMLVAQVVSAGGTPEYLGIARDDRGAVRSLIARGLANADILVIAGGVSVGKFDLVPAVLDELGVTTHVRQVRMKPGKPLLFGTKDESLVFGLPGNPVSAFVCFALFVVPALRRLAGHAKPGPRRTMLPMAEALAVSNDRPTYHPARLELGAAGWTVQPLPWLGAPDLRGLLPADALLVLPPGDTRLDRGQPAAVVVGGEWVSGGVVSGGVVSDGVVSGGVVSDGVVSGESGGIGLPTTHHSTTPPLTTPPLTTSPLITPPLTTPSLTTHHSPLAKREGFPTMPRVFVPAILTGVLLWAAFFPLDFGPLGFVALVPWLMLVRAPVSRRRRYFAAYVGAFTFFALATNWVRVAHPMMYWAWAGLSLVLPVFWVLGLDVIRRFDRLGVPLAASVPAAWVAFEYVRMHFPTGFPFLKPLGLYQMIGFGWYFLGYTQHSFLHFIQIADAGGIYAVSFVVGAVNGLAADWAMRSGLVRRWLRWPAESSEVVQVCRTRLLVASAAVFVIVGGTLGYGFIRLEHPAFRNGPLVAALQGNVPQGEKMMKSNVLEVSYEKLYMQALQSNPRPDLVIWPETCFFFDWYDVAPGQSAPPSFQKDVDQCEKIFTRLPACLKLTEPAYAAMRKDRIPETVLAKLAPYDGKLLSLAEFIDVLWKSLTRDEFYQFKDPIVWYAYFPLRVPVLLGLSAVEWEDGKQWKYNSALLLNEKGTKAGRYDKMHLVPFGEYVPLHETFPFLQEFTPYTEEYACRPGEHWMRFPLTTHDKHWYLFACLICYEDSDPDLARQYAEDGSLSFFVNISNDGWFDGTEEHEQHLAICRFRAVESRRAIVRSVNMGISGVIDSDGRVVALPGGSWRESKKVEAVVATNVPLDERTSWYGRLGDWVPTVCWCSILSVIVLAVLRRGEVAVPSPTTVS